MNTSSLERFAMHVSTSGLRPRSEKLRLTVHTASFGASPRRGGGKLAYRHRRVGLGRREDLVLAEVRKERTFLTEGRHLGEDVQAEVAPLELALAEVAPLGEGDRLLVTRCASSGRHRGRGSVTARRRRLDRGRPTPRDSGSRRGSSSMFARHSAMLSAKSSMP